MNINKISPQRKIISVADKIGNDFLKNQQGTTKMVYDSVLVNGDKRIVFFEDSNQRSFPLTNVQNSQLKTGEAIAIQRMSLSFLTFSSESNEITDVSDFESGSSTTFQPFRVGELSIKIANETVMKPIRLLHFLPQYNKNGYNVETNIFEFNTDLVVNPQLDFSVEIRVPDYTFVPQPTENLYLSCTIEGVGVQLNLKTTM